MSATHFQIKRKQLFVQKSEILFALFAVCDNMGDLGFKRCMAVL